MVVSTELIKITSFFIQLLFSITLIYGQCNIPNCDSCSSSDLTCTRCVSGFYPYFATCTACSKGCVNVTSGPTCDSTSGICARGCTPGWIGEKCDRCDSNYYKAGDTCYKCSDHCASSCDGTTGSCFGGCREGYWGTRCENACSPFCQENACFHTNGTCINECINGFYGLPCETPCGACPCDRTQGTCVGACSVGFYGEQCDIRCQETCLENRCQRQSGNCVLDCPIGFYGVFCSKNCSTGCHGACNRDTGICSTGCKPGFYGDICNNSCNVNCKTGSCDRFSGNCVGDCRDGYFGDKCSELCVCSKNGKSDQTTDFSPGNPTTTRFSPDTDIEPHSCSDIIPIVIGGVVAVVIVLLGSIANYVIWKRNNVETMRKSCNRRYHEILLRDSRSGQTQQLRGFKNIHRDISCRTDIHPTRFFLFS
ncbi:multiple epidermal growth factor-like domains protein 11 isoform X1 [Magallana gigas]|uniref:multiple epidermal growth factor-like domains protein 11 isoform X1 n=1 Tax=Magallana gigas TaxID=29159 RepID=UPI003342AA1F